MLLALSTGDKVGIAVVAAAFIAFALASSFVFPRFRPQFPGHGLGAFIVVSIVFFVGMLTAVTVFGAEPKEHKEAGSTAETTPTSATTATTATQATTTAPSTAPVGAPQVVQVTEKEFKISLSTPTLKAGVVTFKIKNAGAIPHDLAIVGGPKSALIPAGGTGTLSFRFKAGTTELYCSVPGHKAAGMDLKVNVTGAASTTTTTTAAPTPKPAAAPQVVDVTEKEFKIILATQTLKAGPVTFKIKNAGAIPHDLAIVGGPKSALINAGGTGTLHATLKAGTVELYCSVPGHKAAGMDIKVTVS